MSTGSDNFEIHIYCQTYSVIHKNESTGTDEGGVTVIKLVMQSFLPDSIIKITFTLKKNKTLHRAYSSTFCSYVLWFERNIMQDLEKWSERGCRCAYL